MATASPTLSVAAGRYGAPPRFAVTATVVLLLALPACVLALMPGAAAWFEFDRSAIASGELWRPITAHWTHWSMNHLAWDLAAFLLLVILGWQTSPKRLTATLALSSLTIPLGIWFALPEMTRYRGLSGIDSALFVFVAVMLLREEISAGRYRLRIPLVLVLAGFVAKIVFEATTASTLFADSSLYVPVPLAHWIGGVCGGLVGVVRGGSS